MADPPRLPRLPGSSQSGQASLEYAAVLGLVAVVLVLVGTVFAAPGVANAVGLSVRRALCIVGGGTCLVAEPHPCTVRSTTTNGKATVKLGFFRLGRGLGLLRSESSDGSVTLTLLDNLQAGVEAGLGVEGHLRLGHVELGEGELAQVQAVAQLGGGRSWEVPDAEHADRLQRRLAETLAGRSASALPGVGPTLKLVQKLFGRGEARDLPAPSSVVVEAGGSLSAHGQSGGIALDASLSAMGGVRENRRTGRRTYLLRVDGAGAAALADEMGRAKGETQVTLAYTVDRAGTPLELGISTQVTAAGHLGLPARLPQSGHGVSSAQGQLTASLDLSDAGDRAAARRLLIALPQALSAAHAAPALLAVADIGRRLADHGRLDLSRYAVDHRDYGGGGEVAGGMKAGLDVELSRSAQRLQDAWSRPSGGVWERRVDCLTA